MIQGISRPLLAAAFALGLAAAASAQVRVTEAWVAPTPAKQNASPVYLKIQATQDNMRFAHAESNAGPLRLYETTATGVHVLEKGVVLPKGQTVEFKPGGYHLVLSDLQQPLKVGDKVKVYLGFSQPGGQTHTQQMEVPVRAPATAAAGAAR